MSNVQHSAEHLKQARSAAGRPPVDVPAERIVVVDDDQHICAMLRYLLEDEGYRVEACYDTRRVAAAIQDGGVNLLVLDVAIGPEDGFAVLTRLRRHGPCPPVIFLSGHDERAARLRAFELGALDYLTKPIDVVELVARVRVALQRVSRARSARRAGPAGPARGGGTRPAAPGLTLQPRRCTVTRPDGTVVRLTPHETRLLKVLMDHDGTVVAREALLDAVWGVDFDGDSNIIEVYVRRLRRKLDDGAQGHTCLHTIRGLGYAYAPTSHSVEFAGLA